MLPGLPMAKSAWGPGSIIAERYRLLDWLGRGGMGEVWRAEHLTLGGVVAVKLISAEVLAEAEDADDGEHVLARFLREAQAAAALRSPHVVQILDHGIHGGVPFMAMEVLEGETLGHRLERIRVLPYAQTARVITHVARALARAHEAGIVHRDLKPENIFLVRNDDEEIAKVLDFGIAKMTRAQLGHGGPATRSGHLVGTPSYMSPEQMEGTRPVDFRSDLWSVGVIAFECLCGRLPFDGKTFAEIVLQVCTRPLPVPSKIAAVPPGFDAWFAKALKREPEERFQSARELAEELRAILTPDAEEIADGMPTRPRWRVRRDGMVSPARLLKLHRRRKEAVIGGLVLLVGVALSVWLLGVQTTPPEPAALLDTATTTAASSSPVPSVTPGPTASAESTAITSAAPTATARQSGKPIGPRVPPSVKTAKPGASVRLGI